MPDSTVTIPLDPDSARSILSALKQRKQSLLRSANEVTFRRASYMPVSEALLDKLAELNCTESLIHLINVRIATAEGRGPGHLTRS